MPSMAAAEPGSCADELCRVKRDHRYVIRGISLMESRYKLYQKRYGEKERCKEPGLPERFPSLLFPKGSKVKSRGDQDRRRYDEYIDVPVRHVVIREEHHGKKYEGHYPERDLRNG